jgi:hypothetical protein
MTQSADDGLRARLSRIDPAGPQVPVDLPTSPRAAELMERAMQTSDVPSTAERVTAPRRRRRPVLWLAAAAGAVAVAAAAAGFLVSRDPDTSAETAELTTLALALPPSDVMGSCVQFDVAFLRDMPVAFAGTATAVDDRQVTLDVAHWYKGGDADRVTIAVPDGQTSAALDGVDFRAGEHYLVTATDGMVNGCGFSGPATPQLEDAYREAFGA